MPSGLPKTINSSIVAFTMPAPRLCPAKTFFPTLATSESVPVFTGHRSTPGFVTNINGTAKSASGVSSRPSAFAAALICLATASLTTGSVFTFLKGGPSGGSTTTVGPSGGVTTTTGGTTSGTTTTAPPPSVTVPTPPTASPLRPNTTNRGVQSRFD